MKLPSKNILGKKGFELTTPVIIVEEPLWELEAAG